MTLYFTKMHGLGNDFMVIDAIHQSVCLEKRTIIDLAKRNTGIGFDQCLLIEPASEPGVDFFYRIFNADGQESGQCGNGARCLARYVHRNRLTDNKRLTIATKTTRMELLLNSDETVTVNFGRPDRRPAHIPLQVDREMPAYRLPLSDGRMHEVHALSIGNPHAVSLVQDIQTASVAVTGREISEHPWFPEQVNAGFMEIVDQEHLRLRVYERGCGETRACGSGAVAAAAVARLFYQSAKRIHVDLPGGRLLVEWPDINGPIYQTGPAAFVFEGSLCI